MSTSFKNQNIGLISGWGHGETNWGTPLNDNLMILDTLCQSVVKKIISSPDQQPIDVSRGDSYVYAIDTELINLNSNEIKKNDIIIFKSNNINDFLIISPKKSWKIFNNDDSSTYIYNLNNNNLWEKESLIKKYNSFIELPSIGQLNVIYIVDDESAMYSWNNDKLIYEKIFKSITDIKKIICGNSNEEN